MAEERSIYEIIGGDITLKTLVDIFYARVAKDETLREMFPEELEPGKRWQYLFLRQFFGGPMDYGVQRGHPRLRMRHAPFRIDQKARDAWLSHMLTALEEIDIEDSARIVMRDYFERASTHMINTYEPEDSSDE